ncbi:MAG: serine hydrolase, partial [Nocardioidaceae bacterium]
ADARHYAASTMKLALVMAAYREAEAGRVDLDAPVLIHDGFASAVGGEHFWMDADDDSDPEPWRRMGTEVSLRWLCHRAIVKSSNLATNLVLDATGTHPVTDVLSAVGATGSVVARGIEDCVARDSGLQNFVTAADLACTLQALHAEKVATPETCHEILSVLSAQQINDAIPAGLPRSAKVAHKSGWVEGISHDAAIIYPGDADAFVFVMCTTSELDEQAGLALIAHGAAASWQDRRVLG